MATDAKLQEDKAKSAEKETSGYREKMRTYEKEIEELSVKVDTKEKAWKRAESELAKLRKTPAAGAQGNSAHTEKKLKAMQTTINAYKAKVICSLCHENDKNTVIKKCGHAFCSKCIDDAIKTRQRRCPSCHTQFGLGDISKLFLQ